MSKKILVVEDTEDNRQILRDLLGMAGYDMIEAHDGAQGVAMAAEHRPDLILMDIQMPGMDGLEACRRIRALAGASARTPIIALTANVLSHQRDTYLAAGMEGVVGKPVSPAALLAEISRLASDPEPETRVA